MRASFPQMLSNSLWHLGKVLQMLALVLGPYAFFVGLSTTDARRELTLLLIAVGFFLAGWLLVRYTEKQ